MRGGDRLTKQLVQVVGIMADPAEEIGLRSEQEAPSVHEVVIEDSGPLLRHRRRIPIMSLLVCFAILFIDLLIAVEIMQYPNHLVGCTAFTSPWINWGGFLKHGLPNTIFFAVVTIPTELSVGSLNFFLQWCLNIYLHLPQTYFRFCGMKTNGCGSSSQVFFQVTVFGGALFLSKFLFPALNKAGATPQRHWTTQAILKELGWWLIGFSLLFCGGWLWNGIFRMINNMIDPDVNWAHYIHNLYSGLGYFGTLLLGALLWYQNPLDTTSLRDLETKFGSYRIVWIKRQTSVQEVEVEAGGGQQPSQQSIPAKNHPIFPYCREIVLMLSIVVCYGAATLVLAPAAKFIPWRKKKPGMKKFSHCVQKKIDFNFCPLGP